MKFVKLSILFLYLSNQFAYPHGITSYVETCGGLGGNVSSYALAVLLAQKYNLKLFNPEFEHSELFNIDRLEKVPSTIEEKIYVKTENDIRNNLGKKNVLFLTNRATRLDYIDNSWIALLKQLLQPKEAILLPSLPPDCVTVAVHIRKGNNPKHFDGKLSSEQLFDFDRSKVIYTYNFNYYCFDPRATYARPFPKDLSNSIKENEKQIDKVKAWGTKFPPEQYYIDQIIWLYNQLPNKHFYIRIFTDDKDPATLFKRIKDVIRKPNIQFDYVRTSFEETIKNRVINDLGDMARFDVLIRSQSYFPRTAELMGNNKLVIFPLTYVWQRTKLIMTEIAIKGDLARIR